MDNLTVWALAIPIIWWVLQAIWNWLPSGFGTEYLKEKEKPPLTPEQFAENLGKVLKKNRENIALMHARSATALEEAQNAHDMAQKGGLAEKLAAEKIKKFS